MLKNERLIHRLTLNEKISLILSNKKDENGDVSGYEFPKFHLNSNPFKEYSNISSTSFPSYKALAMTFNSELITDVARISGEENLIFTKEPFYNFKTKLKESEVSSDPIVYGNFLSSYFNGLAKTGSLSSLDIGSYESDDQETKLIEKEIDALDYYKILRDNSADFIIVESASKMIDLKRDGKITSFFFGRTKNKEEIVKFINNGVFQIFYEGDYETAVDYLIHALDVYQNIHGKYKNNLISFEEYNNQLLMGKALSMEALDNACDDYITFLLKVDRERRKSEAEAEFMLPKSDAKFDYIDHSKIALDAARESIVLLKNDNNVLPIKPRKKVAIIGDAFKNESYYREMFSHPSISFRTPFEIIKDYLEIDYVGYAHGYLKGQKNDDILLEKAALLVKEADVVVIYLWASKDDKKIPDEQLEVLDKCYQAKNVPIIAIVNTYNDVDLSFLDKCSGCLLVYDVGEGIARATLDIISGNENPSGKLVSDYIVVEDKGDEIENAIDTDPLEKIEQEKNEDEEDGVTMVDVSEPKKDEKATLPAYTLNQGKALYPFGYGLSYTTFKYSSFKVSSREASFVITNTGDYAGYVVVELYVSKDDSKSSLKHKMLRDYRKIFLNVKENIKVVIPFSDETFRCFDSVKNCYGIEGGRYNISLASSYNDTIIVSTITLPKFLDRRFAFTESEAITPKTLHEFENKEDITYKKDFGIKLAISTILSIYILAALFFFWYMALYKNKATMNNGLYIFITILVVLIDIFIVVYASIYNKKNKEKEENLKKKYEKTDLSLANLINNISEFNATDKIIYDVKKEVEEEEIIEETEVITPVEKEEERIEEYQEVDLEVEKEDDIIEEIIDINDAVLTEEEIKEHELEEIMAMEEQNQDKEIADDFLNYEENTNFDTSTSLSETIDRFKAYAESRGIFIELPSVRSLFSSLASSKIIILSSKSKELLPSIVEILNDFLGDQSHIFEALDTWTSNFYLVWRKKESGEYVKTEFANDIYNACRFKNNLNLAIINNVNIDNVDLYLDSFIDFSLNPTKANSFKLDKRHSLRIPENLALILLPQDDDYMERISPKLALASFSVELVLRKNEMADGSLPKPDALSYNYFKDLIVEAKKTWFLEEKSWKKIDGLENELKQYGNFRITNKLTIAIENYTSVYINCGGEEIDALDSVVSEAIVPIIKTLPIYKSEDGIKRLTEIMVKHFEEENIVKIKRALQSSLKDNLGE